jgi:integrase
MGLGPYPLIGLADARLAALEARRAAARGEDPIAFRAQSRVVPQAAPTAITFRAAALATIEAKRVGWSNPKHEAQWLATLQQHALPKLGERAVADIDTAAVLDVLRPIWSKIPETASRLRGRIESVLDVARVQGWRTGENPARWKGHLSEALAAPRKVQRVQHHPALPWTEMPTFMAALRGVDGIGALALRFAILTAARTGEVRGMTWSEVGLAAGIWTVPADRMKARRLHRVPLSPAACDILAALRPQAVESEGLIFFGSRPDTPLSDMTLSAVTRRMNEDQRGSDGRFRWCDIAGHPIVPHGFRSTFRDWAGETRPEGREIVERALAHTIRDKAEAAYARSDLLERRRPLMDAWAAYCLGGLTI